MRKNKTAQLIGITLLALAAVLFGGTCSSKTGSEADLPVASAPDLSKHPIYNNQEFGEDESMLRPVDIEHLAQGG